MVDIIKHLSGNRIIGDLIAREKYAFVDGKLIASIVDDVMVIVNKAVMVCPIKGINCQHRGETIVECTKGGRCDLCPGKPAHGG